MRAFITRKGSLKARLCVAGKELLYAYCAERGIAHKRCGKLIVATDPSQIPQLQAIQAKAAANGVNDLEWLSAEQAQVLEPQLACGCGAAVAQHRHCRQPCADAVAAR